MSEEKFSSVRECEDALVESLAKVLGRNGSRNGLTRPCFSWQMELDVRLAIAACLAKLDRGQDTTIVILTECGVRSLSQSPSKALIIDARSGAPVRLLPLESELVIDANSLMETVHDELSEQISNGSVNLEELNKYIS